MVVADECDSLPLERPSNQTLFPLPHDILSPGIGLQQSERCLAFLTPTCPGSFVLPWRRKLARQRFPALPIFRGFSFDHDFPRGDLLPAMRLMDAVLALTPTLTVYFES